MLVDTHCHLFFDELKKDLDGVLSRAAALGVTKFICVGTNVEDSQHSYELSLKYENIFSKSKVVALGEIGLDYFKNISDKKIQKNIFREQLELAQEINVPIVFHNRDSDKDILDTLSKFPDVIGVAHCFSSTYEVAKKLIDMGFYISFSGNLTFKNSHLPDVAKKLPLNKILVETDSPFLSPVPHRGKVNEPGRTRFVAELLAKLHGSTINQIASITTNNATNLFNL